MQPRCIIPHAPQNTDPVCIFQSAKFIDKGVCCRIIPAVDMGPCAEIQHVHQRRGVADLARNLERVLGVCERGLGIAEQPKANDFQDKVAAPTSWPKRVARGRCSAGS